MEKLDLKARKKIASLRRIAWVSGCLENFGCKFYASSNQDLLLIIYIDFLCAILMVLTCGNYNETDWVSSM